MQYWASAWDWECPTLFGIELGEWQAIRARWPDDAGDGSEALLASSGALRELLYGASAQPDAAIESLIGISAERAQALLKDINQALER